MDPRYGKVRAAAIAGWWTLLVAVGMAIVFWVLFLIVSHRPPAWISNLWGGLSWETIRNVAVWMITVFRLMIWLIFLLVIWLTIWSAGLKKIG